MAFISQLHIGVLVFWVCTYLNHRITIVLGDHFTTLKVIYVICAVFVKSALHLKLSLPIH